MSIDTSGVRGHVWRKGQEHLLECGCKVKCGTYPQIVVSCQEQPNKGYTGRCLLWKWELDHSICKGSVDCHVKEEEDGTL